MKFSHFSALLLFLVLIMPAKVLAQNNFSNLSKPIKIKNNGKEHIIKLSPESLAAKKSFTVWFQSKGYISHYIDISLKGPLGLRASVRGNLPKKGKALTKALASSKGWWPIDMKSSTGKALTQLKLSAASNKKILYTPLALDPMCELFRAQFPELRKLIKQYTGRTLSDKEICEWLKNQNGSGGSTGGTQPGRPDYGSITARGLLHKNTCSRDKSALYPVRLDINIAKINPALYPEGAEFIVTASNIVYRGSKAASIKPKSDGKYAPQPVGVFAAIGGYMFGREEVQISKWNKSGRKAVGVARVADYTYAYGRLLGRTPLGKLLRGGGYATFDVSNGQNAYSVCFRLVARRQVANGYKCSGC